MGGLETPSSENMDEASTGNVEGEGVSSALDMFTEHEQVRQMILAIPTAVKVPITAEKSFEDLKTLLDEYQEQPHLLDPYLEDLLGQLVTLTRDNTQATEVISQGFKYLWLFTKVRGYKTIVKKLPHEVKDLLPVLQLLESEEIKNDFYGSYVLLMWLSIIVYMPFNMMGFDETVTAPKEGDTIQPTVVERIMTVIKYHLKSAQTSREMAAYLASRFVTRPDLKKKFLPEFIKFCFGILEVPLEEQLNIFHKMGVLQALGLIFKHGKREELMPFSEEVLNRLIEFKILKASDTPLRKLSIKLVQRLGLTFLKPKIASWRYKRGMRSLSHNMGGSGSGDKGEEMEADEEEDEVPPEVEEVIDNLLLGLKDKDTIVRWSAAKGVGRVTGRLPREFADEVVGAILELFSTRESYKAWHGGCLALAELARRGLLLPERLSDVLPVLEKALIYDELKGQSSVGSNIRDAACYLCWAFARAYHPDQMREHVNKLATGLLIVALFDREIPCRRAGSAAFQEHVGRQGTFPYGIEILTTVDYFAVGNRSNAFLELSVDVGKYSEYTTSLINHLLEKKVDHWDSAVRDLTAKALHNLTPLAPQYTVDNVLPKLIEQMKGTVLIARHGAILSLAHIVHALAIEGQKQNKSLKDLIGEAHLEAIQNLVNVLEERKHYKGMGGEYMKQATCVLIEKCSLAAVPFHSQPVIQKWLKMLEECSIYAEENIRSAAVEALSPFFSEYFKVDTDEGKLIRDDLIRRYTSGLKADQETKCLGFASVLGCLPKCLVEGKFETIMSALISGLEINSTNSTWALARKAIVLAMARLVNTVGIQPDADASTGVCRSNIDMIYKALIQALEDYTMDRRGDVGAWVREASLTTLQGLTLQLVKVDSSMLSEEIVKDFMPRVCQQASERIDRTRKVAGSTFANLLHSTPVIPHIPNREVLEEIFPKDLCDTTNWASESSTFNMFTQLLDLPAYRTRVLLGITYSAGGVSANLSRYTYEALHDYLNGRSEKLEVLNGFVEALLQIFNDNQRLDRVILPLIKTIGDLLSASAVLDVVLETDDSYSKRLITLLRKECLRCSDYHKLSATITVFCELLRIEGNITKTCLTQLALFLGFQYPKVRAITATSLLTALQDYSDRPIVPEENLDQVISILEETEWLANMDEARKQRNKLSELMEIPVPQVRKK